MTTLRLHDLRRGDALARVVLWLAVAVLALAVAVHHGWAGGHAAMGHSGEATTHPSASSHVAGAGHHGPDPTAHAHTETATATATTATATAASEHGSVSSHDAALGLCLAALLGTLAAARPQLLRRARAILATRRARRTPQRRRPATPLGVTRPARWLPPPRGGPPALATLCVSRR